MGNSKACALRRASSLESVGSLTFTCKNCKYKLGDNTGGNVADIVSNFKGVSIFLVDRETDSVKIALFGGLLWGKGSREIGELNLSHHLI